MNDPRDDRELCEQFGGLRREVAANTPSFEATLAALHTKRPLEQRRRPWRVLAMGGLGAGVALWLIWGPMLRRAEPPHPSSLPISDMLINGDIMPTDVLLDPPGVDVWGTLPALGCLDPTVTCVPTERPGWPAQDTRHLIRMDA